MTSEEEEGPSVATSTTPSAATISRVTTAVTRCDSVDAVTTSSPYRLPSPHKKKEEKEEEIEEEEEEEEEGIIQEERMIQQRDCEDDDEDDEDDEDDDDSSDTSVLVVPYPELAPCGFLLPETDHLSPQLVHPHGVQPISFKRSCKSDTYNNNNLL
ncbi:hypothetical protein OYC64_016267 [Pagothenia borchgrevinki]|uniref:Uncharacterized protein n=1 Tax=Pagothenia borchgrevinki TaxID=8213 RepID=A0ABD2HIP6_PAGBO